MFYWSRLIFVHILVLISRKCVSSRKGVVAKGVYDYTRFLRKMMDPLKGVCKQFTVTIEWKTSQHHTTTHRPSSSYVSAPRLIRYWTLHTEHSFSEIFILQRNDSFLPTVLLCNGYCLRLCNVGRRPTQLNTTPRFFTDITENVTYIFLNIFLSYLRWRTVFPFVCVLWFGLIYNKSFRLL